MITRKELANMFDHSLLQAYNTKAEFMQLCKEADENGFKMVAINSAPVKLCAELLKDTPVHVGAAIGFPLGQSTIAVKIYETQQAIKDGADEIDYVINLAELKSGNWDYVKDEMSQLVALCRENQVIIKVIFENCYLEKFEIIKLCEIALEVKPDFIKTSTGFGHSGATVEDVALMSSIVKGAIGVKAAGQIRDWPTCKAMIAAGATRIGTSSSFKILAGYDLEYKTEDAK